MTVTRWTRLAAVWLLGMGTFIVGVAVYGIASSRWACDQPPEYSGYQFACDAAWILGAVAAVVAALHLLAGASVWRGQVRGAVVGALIALLGLLACLSLLAHEPWWLVLPASAGYLGTSLVLAYEITGWWDRERHATQP